MHNGQPNGPSGFGTTEDGAYTLNWRDGVGPSVPRNPIARWWLPSEDEWYKAAYYNPFTSSYYDYPTSSNEMPTGSSQQSSVGGYRQFNKCKLRNRGLRLRTNGRRCVRAFAE